MKPGFLGKRLSSFRLSGLHAAGQPAAASASGMLYSVGSMPLEAVSGFPMSDEVAGVMGMPLVSTENLLEYSGAQFYLRNNVVTGWKVDSEAELQHVWLSPGQPIDAKTVGFTMSSPRSLVIAVQGTPTLLTENKLGYGKSEVFLEDGRVVGWNDNHASTRLRVVSHRAQVASK